MRELKCQREALDSKLVEIEEEEMPSVSISDVDVIEMADLMRDIVKTTKDSKRLRTFFSSFIEKIDIKEAGAVIHYDRSKVMNRAGIDTVHSNAAWLPDLDSNQGPAD
jgi:hypothetical protein